MVRPALRSTSLRRKKVTTPGGKRVVHYSRKKTGKASCSECGAPLSGVKIKKGHVNTPNRPYGGNMCSKCTRAFIKSTVI